LFEPDDAGTFTPQERWAVATFVAGVHDRPEARVFYEERLAGAGAGEALRATLAAEIAVAMTQGPYGDYPPGPLTAENTAGPVYRVSGDARRLLGERLSSALEHTHMLVFHPREAAPPSLAALLDAGWSTTDVVTLSQLVAFLSYQIRVAAGLQVLAGRPSA
jgi:CMD domain protein